MKLYLFFKNGVKKQKDDWDKQCILSIIGSLFSGYTCTTNNGNLRGHVKFVCHAFGVTPPPLRNSVKKLIHTNYTMEWCVKKDEGKTILNSPKKRQARFAA